MTIEAKLRPDEIALVDIIRHPVLGPEFIRNIEVIPEDGTKEEWEKIWAERDIALDYYYIHTDYQILMNCDFNSYVSFCTARSVGKTEVLIDKIIFYLLNAFWGDEYIVFLAPNKVHVEPVFRKLTRWLRNNQFLKHLIDRRSINSASLDIKLKSGGVMDARIAGTSGTGANVVGLHTPVILIDESAYFPWGTWQELQRCLNEWMEGFQMIVAGVPDGRRDSSVLYYVDQKDPLFRSHNLASHRNPRWTADSELRAQEQFGGINSEDYLHMVLGEHGSPVWSVFDRVNMLFADYETHIKELRGEDMKENPQAGYRHIFEIPRIPTNAETVLIGIDLGYTDPTAVLIHYLSNDKWYQHARLKWVQIPYNDQEKLIASLAEKFNPGLMGIDEGSSGKAVIQHLFNDDKHKNRHFDQIIEPINFASTITIGQDEEGKDIKVRAKAHGVQYLQELTNTHKIVYPRRDEELISELERTTYTKSIQGQLTFKTATLHGGMRGGDHNLAALLSGFLAWYLRNESTFNLQQNKPRLLRPRWMV